MKRIVKGKGSKGGVVKIAAGLATLAVGAYLLYGKGAKARRTKVKGWAGHVAHEVKQHAKQLAEMDREGFNRVVDNVVDQYGKMKVVNSQELQRVSKGLKEAWATLGQKIKSSNGRTGSSKS